MFKTKLILRFFIFLFISFTYGQKGFRVDKDYRIKKYQKEMIQFLIDHNQFGKDIKTRNSLVKNYSNLIGITKCIEVFNSEPKFEVLLVRFYSFGSGADDFWGILEKDNNYLFYFNEKDISPTVDYLKKYDLKTQKILFDYLKIYKDWSGPNLHSPQIIEENKN